MADLTAADLEALSDALTGTAEDFLETVSTIVDRHTAAALRAPDPTFAPRLLDPGERTETRISVPRMPSATCSRCRRVRSLALGRYPMDAYDYHPLQMLSSRPLGWYSGPDGEMCPACLTRTLNTPTIEESP